METREFYVVENFNPFEYHFGLVLELRAAGFDNTVAHKVVSEHIKATHCYNPLNDRARLARRNAHDDVLAAAAATVNARADEYTMVENVVFEVSDNDDDDDPHLTLCADEEQDEFAASGQPCKAMSPADGSPTFDMYHDIVRADS